MAQSQRPEDHSEIWKNLGLFSVIITELLGYTGAGIALGYWAWAKLGAPAWALPLAGLAGLILAFYQIFRLSRRAWGGTSDMSDTKRGSDENLGN